VCGFLFKMVLSFFPGLRSRATSSTQQRGAMYVLVCVMLAPLCCSFCLPATDLREVAHKSTLQAELSALQSEMLYEKILRAQTEKMLEVRGFSIVFRLLDLIFSCTEQPMLLSDTAC
jgi:hypothetical protein